MSSRPHLFSRELTRTESDQAPDSESTWMERGREGLPHHLRPTASTPVLGHHSRSPSHTSIYSGKQNRTHSPDLTLKPARPAIRFPPGFEFVENTYTPSASILELASSDSHPTNASSAENLRASSESPPPLTAKAQEYAPNVPQVEVSAAQTADKGNAKRHPASVIAKVSRPVSPASVEAASAGPSQAQSEESLADAPVPAKHTAFETGHVRTPTTDTLSRDNKDDAATLLSLDDNEEPTRPTPASASKRRDEAHSTQPQNASAPIASEEPGGDQSNRLHRWRRRSTQDDAVDDAKKGGRDAKSPSVLERAASHLQPGRHKATPADEVLDAAETEGADAAPSWSKLVGFDTMPDALETASEVFSFALQAKTQGYQRSKNTRIFMCAVDANFYSETALAWCMEHLVEDGDEVIAVRVVEGEKEELDQEAIREQARDLLDQIADMNDELPGRKISIVVEFVHGRPTSTILRLIHMYRPNSLSVGTRGRSANTFQKLLGGAPMIGHVSRDILQRSPVPVVVVRPEAKVRKHLNKRLKDPSRRAYRNLVCTDPEPKTANLPLSAGHSGSLAPSSSQHPRH